MIHDIDGNQVQLLRSGEEYFPALLAAFEGARDEIWCESYTLEDDRIGQQVMAALVAAAVRGVRVHVLVDGVGSRAWVNAGGPDKLREQSVRVAVFRPERAWWNLRRSRLRRMHRKLMVIDAELAFVGGINLEDDLEEGVHRFDFAVALRGPLVADVHNAVWRMWRTVTWAERGARAADAVPGRARALPQRVQGRITFLVRDNLWHRHDIERAYRQALRAAHHEVLIANAYFFPGRRFRADLQHAAQRGVKVTLVLAGVTDHPLLALATRALYPQFRALGIDIVEYEESQLHAKVAIVDDEWATVGSSNIDTLSLFLAREANIFVRDRGFAGELAACVQAAIEDGERARQIDTAAVLTPWQRLKARLAYQLVRGLIGLAGYGHHH